MARKAGRRGRPPTAGVGCSSPTNPSAEGAGRCSRPDTRVARCDTVESRTTSAGAATGGPAQAGASASSTAATSRRCSSASLAEPDSPTARRSASSAGGPPAAGPLPYGHGAGAHPERDGRPERRPVPFGHVGGSGLGEPGATPAVAPHHHRRNEQLARGPVVEGEGADGDGARPRPLHQIVAG